MRKLVADFPIRAQNLIAYLCSFISSIIIFRGTITMPQFSSYIKIKYIICDNCHFAKWKRHLLKGLRPITILICCAKSAHYLLLFTLGTFGMRSLEFIHPFCVTLLHVPFFSVLGSAFIFWICPDHQGVFLSVNLAVCFMHMQNRNHPVSTSSYINIAQIYTIIR